MKRTTLQWLLLGLLLIVPTALCDDAADEEESESDAADTTIEEDDEDAEAESEASHLSATDLDSEGEVESEGEQPSADADTAMLFVRPTIVGNELPVGRPVTFLVGLYNKGPDDFVVYELEASLRHPMDFTYHLQNYTHQKLQRTVEAGKEAAFEYTMWVNEQWAGRPMGLVVNLRYKDTDVQYTSAVFNETVTMVEDESGFNPETGFLYVLLGCFVILLLVLGQQGLSKMKRSHGYGKKSAGAPPPGVEMGTSNKNEVDFEWIPREVLNMQNKSPGRPGGAGSPRARRQPQRRSAGTSDD